MSDYTSWHVGMEVVAREDAPHRDKDTREAANRMGLTSPKRGQVYTIREITTGHLRKGEVVCLRFREIDNRHCRHAIFNGGEFAFAAHLFRPVQKRKTDISVFTAMLHDKKERAPA